MVTVRRARSDAHERSRLAEICLLTGAAGGDATDLLSDPTLLTDAYLTPYLEREPDLCLVLADEADVPVGYAIGTADTAAFEQWCTAQWWPSVRARSTGRTSPPRSDLERHLVDRLADRVPKDPQLLERFPRTCTSTCCPSPREAATAAGSSQRSSTRSVRPARTASTSAWTPPTSARSASTATSASRSSPRRRASCSAWP